MINLKFVKGLLFTIGFLCLAYLFWMYLIPTVFRFSSLPLVKELLFKSVFTNPFIVGSVGAILVGFSLFLDRNKNEM